MIGVVVGNYVEVASCENLNQPAFQLFVESPQIDVMVMALITNTVNRDNRS